MFSNTKARFGGSYPGFYGPGQDETKIDASKTQFLFNTFMLKREDLAELNMNIQCIHCIFHSV